MSTATEEPRVLVTIPTFNELENLPPLLDEIYHYAPLVDVLVIDDNSPDGTGQWCRDQSRTEKRLRCLHRAGKLGLGTATIAGMRYALEHNYDYVLNMDADFSHPPRYIPHLLAAVSGPVEKRADVAIGSRYVSGGQVQGWPFARRLISRCLNLYARLILRLPVRDCSGAFRCYRTDVLRTLQFESIRSRGYSFQEEMLWHLHRQGARFSEIPIVFVNRQKGQSKINWREAIGALWIILSLGIRPRYGPGRRAAGTGD